MDYVERLQQTIDDNIPLVSALGASVASYDGQTLIVELPLAPNVNHKNTAFGGSLYCAGVLSAWGLLYLKLLEVEEEGVIVIFDGRVHYHKPVTEAFKSICELSDHSAWEKFIKIYRRMGKARLKIESEIICDDQVCASFYGEFVVQKD